MFYSILEITKSAVVACSNSMDNHTQGSATDEAQAVPEVASYVQINNKKDQRQNVEQGCQNTEPENLQMGGNPDVELTTDADTAAALSEMKARTKTLQAEMVKARGELNAYCQGDDLTTYWQTMQQLAALQLLIHSLIRKSGLTNMSEIQTIANYIGVPQTVLKSYLVLYYPHRGNLCMCQFHVTL